MNELQRQEHGSVPEKTGNRMLEILTPDNYLDMWKLAGHLSDSGILPNALKGKPGAVLSIMARGAYLGIPWPVAVQEAYVVKGKVAWPASILASIVATSPDFEYFEILEADDEHATIEAKKHRWKEPKFYTVDMAQAQQAGYLDGNHSEQWKLRPRFMLIAMARREAARMWDPVRCAGLYTLEELESARLPDVAPAAPEARPAAERFSRDAQPAAQQVVPDPVGALTAPVAPLGQDGGSDWKSDERAAHQIVPVSLGPLEATVRGETIEDVGAVLDGKTEDEGAVLDVDEDLTDKVKRWEGAVERAGASEVRQGNPWDWIEGEVAKAGAGDEVAKLHGPPGQK